MIPMRTLPKDTYCISEGNAEMVGLKTGRRFILGDMLTACLTEASALNGALTFVLAEACELAPPKKFKKKNKLSKKQRKQKLKQNNRKKAKQKQ